MGNFFKDVFSLGKKSSPLSFIGDIAKTAIGQIPVVGSLAAGALSEVQAKVQQKNLDKFARSQLHQSLGGLTGPGLIDTRSASDVARDLIRETTSPLTKLFEDQRAKRGVSSLGSIRTPTFVPAGTKPRVLPGGGKTTSTSSRSTTSPVPRNQPIPIQRSELPVLRRAGEVGGPILQSRQTTKVVRGFTPRPAAGPGICRAPPGKICGPVRTTSTGSKFTPFITDPLMPSSGFRGSSRATRGPGITPVANPFAAPLARDLIRQGIQTGADFLADRLSKGGASVANGALVRQGPLQLQPRTGMASPINKFGLHPITGQLMPMAGALLPDGMKPLGIFRIGPTGDFVRVRKRRMNPLNFRALKRANSRVKSFEKIVLSNFRCEETGRTLKPKKRRVAAKRRR